MACAIEKFRFFVSVFGPKRTHFLAFSSLLLYRSTETHYIHLTLNIHSLINAKQIGMFLLILSPLNSISSESFAT